MRFSQIVRALVVSLLCLGTAEALSAQGYKVIAHPSVAADDAPAAALSKVFLKQTKKLPDGSTVTPADLSKDSPVRDAFTKGVHSRTIAAVETYWQQQIFSGKEAPPSTKGSDAEMIAWVKAPPGAIGYVSSGASTDGLKVIAVK